MENYCGHTTHYKRIYQDYTLFELHKIKINLKHNLGYLKDLFHIYNQHFRARCAERYGGYLISRANGDSDMVYAKCGVCINNLDGGEMYVFRLAIH